MPKQHTDAFRERVGAKWPASIRSICDAALNAADSAEAACKPLNRNAADYRPVARRTLASTGKAFASALRDLAAAQGRVDSERSAFKAKALENADPFAGEIRAHVRGLSLAERAALLLGDKADKQAQQAVLQAPVYLSGIDPAMRTKVEVDFFGRHHAAWVAEQAQAAEAFEHAGASLSYARSVLQREGGLNDLEFAGWLEAECAPEPTRPTNSNEPDPARLAAIDAKLAELI